jgi:hypothetical protein
MVRSWIVLVFAVTLLASGVGCSNAKPPDAQAAAGVVEPVKKPPVKKPPGERLRRAER